MNESHFWSKKQEPSDLAIFSSRGRDVAALSCLSHRLSWFLVLDRGGYTFLVRGGGGWGWVHCVNFVKGHMHRRRG